MIFSRKPAFRRLTNPPGRLEIRPDFPATVSFRDPDSCLRVIREELEKVGITFRDASRIHIAYPHKHPLLFPGHHNNASGYAAEFRQALSAAAPRTEWIMAGALCETVHLNRFGSRSSLHALTGKQIYGIYLPRQEQGFPFIDARNTGREAFVIIDDGVEQGTTAANLMSYIHHNGGFVLAAFTARGGDALAQQAGGTEHGVSLRPEFMDRSKNTGRLPELALAFSESARAGGYQITPQEGLDLFQEKLTLHGHSVFALTDGECRRLIDTVLDRYWISQPFMELIRELDTAPGHNTPPAPA